LLERKSHFLVPFRLYMIFALLSLSFFIIASWQAWPVIAEISDGLGLISHLTPLYWSGIIILSILALLIILRKTPANHLAIIFTAFLFVIYLFGPLIFMFENPHNPSAYYPASEVDLVMNSGHIGSANGYNLLSYRVWPGIHMVSSWLEMVPGLNLLTIIRYFPLFWGLLIILIIL
jgi:hypothetical protein